MWERLELPSLYLVLDKDFTVPWAYTFPKNHIIKMDLSGKKGVPLFQKIE